MSQSNHNNPSSSSPQEPRSQTTNGSSNDPATARSPQSEMVQAFKDLARGEQHATALEANLTNLENRLDALLASIEGRAAQSDQGQSEGPVPDEDEKNEKKD
ncbi:hypothetical protein DL766_002049 [Monosporascus sp. MC13-8B]|uniref:EKC/KEOPS complex subunit GON7 n=1 Tax=Monosporascus cannonballus TaxID=155416 RepID=A0ABY0HDX7_9PEZI|nr:hypothetical protein DL762_002266 [Monosporascus cannonballus]RYP36387.1 hypothetical protein DL766_002049 [Monosporascus sp. MC13-8B]